MPTTVPPFVKVMVPVRGVLGLPEEVTVAVSVTLVPTGAFNGETVSDVFVVATFETACNERMPPLGNAFTAAFIAPVYSTPKVAGKAISYSDALKRTLRSSPSINALLFR